MVLTKFKVWKKEAIYEKYLWPLNSSSTSEEFIQKPYTQVSELDEISKEANILVWPNPSSNQFQLQVNETSKEIAEINCLDIYGSLVYQGMKQETIYNLPNSGVYIIVVSFEDGSTQTAKLIISN